MRFQMTGRTDPKKDYEADNSATHYLCFAIVRLEFIKFFVVIYHIKPFSSFTMRDNL